MNALRRRLTRAGWLLFLAAQVGAAEPKLDWPTEWTVFGPVPETGDWVAGRPDPARLPSGEALTAIPSELVLNGRTVKGRPMRLEEGRLDLRRELAAQWRGAPWRLASACLVATIRADRDVTVQMGAGANWWMQWWLDGRPVFDTLARGNGSDAVTGRDHVFELALAPGAHTLAVIVFGGHSGFELAVASPAELQARPWTFQEAMAAGRQKYRPGHWSTAINFEAARADFLRAVAAASNDRQRAEALVALAENDLYDTAHTNMAGIRADCEAALALEGAAPDQRARAALALGEAWQRDRRYDLARQSFEQARTLSAQPGWEHAVELASARALVQEKNMDAARKTLARLLSATNLDSTVRFFAASLDEALEVAPRIRPEHPRLFFNADTWPAIRQQVDADPKGFGNLRQALQSLPEEFDVKDWGSVYWFKVGDAWKSYPGVMTAALVYRVTGDPALLAKIRKMLRASVDHYLQRTDFNSHVESRLSCAAALDWVWNDLPPEEARGLARDFLRYVFSLHTDQSLMNRSNRHSYYYEPSICWYAGLLRYDSGLDDVEALRALILLGRGYDNHVVAGFGRYLGIMADRGGVGKVDYNFNDLPTPLWTFLHTWRSAVGPVSPEWAFGATIAPSYVLRNMLGFKGSGYRDFGYTHSWRPRDGWQSGSLLYSNLRHFNYFFADIEPEEAGIAAWLMQRMRDAGAGEAAGSYVVYPYLLSASEKPVEPRLPEGLPPARLFGVNGLMLMSSGFDPGESTYALYSSGCTSGLIFSEHFDAGHFTIFKRGFLALDSGTRAGDLMYDFQSVAHNTVLIDMPGETWMRNRVERRIYGGQRELPMNARVVAFETDRLMAYAATDATATYHSNKCARMTRQFLYLPPDHFVVFDRVTSKQAEYPKAWLLHTANEPRIEGKECRADQGEGRIFCRTLLPADAVLEPVGGPGKEFWAGGQNWPIEENSPYLRNMGMTNTADIPENVGRWRVEVKPGAAREEDFFLHLLQAGGQEEARMVDSRLDDRVERVELSFRVGERDYTVAFDKAGEMGGHIKIAENGTVRADKPLTREIMPQTGLALMK